MLRPLRIGLATLRGALGADELDVERASISLNEMRYIHSRGTPSLFSQRPTTRREALAHLASWREPNRPLEGAPTDVPYRASSGMWVLGYATDARLTDEACVDLIWGGTEHPRPASGLTTPRVQEFYLDAHHAPALSRLLACAQLFATARAALVEVLGTAGHYAPPRVPILGGMRAAMARLIVGVDIHGHLADPVPDPPGSFPRELAMFRGGPAPPPETGRGAAPPAADPAPLRSGPLRRSGRRGQ